MPIRVYEKAELGVEGEAKGERGSESKGVGEL